METRLYRTMVSIRSFELKLQELAKKGLLRGSVHFCIGQEAVAAGVMAALRPTDYITSTNRGHGHAIAEGAASFGDGAINQGAFHEAANMADTRLKDILRHVVPFIIASIVALVIISAWPGLSLTIPHLAR